MNRPVDVYFNLRKKKWSIKCRKDGTLIGHSLYCYVDNVSFIVQPAGREKVLQKLQKNVHAFIRGELLHAYKFEEPPEDNIEVTYNPYYHKSFVNKATGKPVMKAERVWMNVMGGKPHVYVPEKEIVYAL